jgi:hypothetical protein
MLTMFETKKLNLKKLVPCGFTKNDDTYIYTTDIVGGQFQMIDAILVDGTVNTKVIDASLTEYVLHRISEACGSFVSMVRADYENILHNIAEGCNGCAFLCWIVLFTQD